MMLKPILRRRWPRLAGIAAIAALLLIPLALLFAYHTAESRRGNRKRMCAFLTEFGSAQIEATTNADALAVLNTYKGRFDQAVQDAPPEVYPDMVVVITALRRAIEQRNPRASDTDQALQAATRIDQYCGNLKL